MQSLRSLGRGVLIILISLSLAAWITIATLQATILQRSVVLGWIDKSGAYNTFVDSIVQLMPTEGSEKELLTESTIRGAIAKTLTPGFLKTSTETIVHASYAWLEGKAQTLSFTIPLADKRPELQKNLAAAVKTQIDTLPVCATRIAISSALTCIPQGMTAASMADDLARRAVESTDFLSQPLTPQGFEPNQIPALAMARWFAQFAPILVWGLPIFATLCVVLYVFLYDNKIVGLRIAGRRIFFATIVTAIIGGSIWLFHQQISLSAFGDQAIISSVIDPVFHQIAGNMSMWLFVFSGSVLLVGGTTWLICSLVEKRQNKGGAQLPPAKPQDLPPVPTPPSSNNPLA